MGPSEDIIVQNGDVTIGQHLTDRHYGLVGSRAVAFGGTRFDCRALGSALLQSWQVLSSGWNNKIHNLARSRHICRYVVHIQRLIWTIGSRSLSIHEKVLQDLEKDIDKQADLWSAPCARL
jgi:hypothetical protein